MVAVQVAGAEVVGFAFVFEARGWAWVDALFEREWLVELGIVIVIVVGDLGELVLVQAWLSGVHADGSDAESGVELLTAERLETVIGVNVLLVLDVKRWRA